jgi:hypothetical protein
LRFGVPDNPYAVVAKDALDAVPVIFPLKEVADTIPATCNVVVGLLVPIPTR